MKKSIYLLIITLVILSLVGCNTDIGQEEDKPIDLDEELLEDEVDEVDEKEEILTIADYYPFNENVTMDYQGIGNEFAEQKTFIEFVEGNRAQMKITNPGTAFVKVMEYKNGALTETFSEGEFYHIENMLDSNANSDNIILKEPLEVGTSWAVEQGHKKTITSINADIDTPSGSYKALEVTTELDDGAIQKDYYVKDIGPVATLYTDGDFHVKTLLEEVIVDSKEIEIKSYYPTTEDIGTGSINQKVKFSTNDDINKKLEKVMKEPPAEELMSSIPEGAKINKINLNRNDWVLEVDFSKELITDMNAGSSLETEIIKSIVNTLGGFYDVDKVYITTDGNPYESGHYALQEGEYFEVDREGVIEY